jgi:hypothetical protein
MRKRDMKRLAQHYAKLNAVTVNRAIEILFNPRSARVGGFRLSRSTIENVAEKLKPTHQTYRLRVCGDKGNHNGGKITTTPPMATQRTGDYVLNPQSVYGGERKTLYKVGGRF